MSLEQPDLNNIKFDLIPQIESSTSSSIYVKWETRAQLPNFVEGYQVHYQKVASSYVQYSLMLPPSTTSYSIKNLVADTYYKVCVVLYRNDTNTEDRSCMDAYTTSWHIPVSIGSSIGAILALSIIVLIVLLSRCPSLLRNQRQPTSDSSKYDSMSSHHRHDDGFEFSDTTMHPEDYSEYVDEDCLSFEPKDPHKHSHVTDPMCNGAKFGRNGSGRYHRGSRKGSRHGKSHHHQHHHLNQTHYPEGNILPKTTILVIKSEDNQSIKNHPV